jgi:hypothetical protein
MEIAITRLRPNTSDSDPATRMAPASAWVVTDIARLARAGLRLNSAENSGMSGWTQYSKAKVAKPAANSATFAQKNSRVPRWMNGPATGDAAAAASRTWVSSSRTPSDVMGESCSVIARYGPSSSVGTR